VSLQTSAFSRRTFDPSPSFSNLNTSTLNWFGNVKAIPRFVKAWALQNSK